MMRSPFSGRSIALVAAGLACCLHPVALAGTNTNRAPTGYVDVMDFVVPQPGPQWRAHEGIQAAFAEAARRGMGVYISKGLPIGDSISIDGVTEIIGGGLSGGLAQYTPDKDIFVGKSVSRLTLRGVWLGGGRNQLVLGSGGCEPGIVLIDRCTFNNAGEAAVRCLPDARFNLLIDNSVLVDNRQNLIATSPLTSLRNSWISTDHKTNHPPATESVSICKSIWSIRGDTNRPPVPAAMENTGTLFLENILGVPRTFGANNRWVDNRGHVTARFVRFGGECGGMTEVVQLARAGNPTPYGSIIFDRSHIYCAGQSAVLLMDGVPQTMVLQDPSEALPLMVNTKYDLQAALDRMPHPDAVQIFVPNPIHCLYGIMPEALLPRQIGMRTRLGGGLALPSGDSPPNGGVWRSGQFVRNPNLDQRWNNPNYAKPSKPGEAEPYGWICVEGGKEARWKEARFLLSDP